jgi:hypothetical protein
VTFELISCRRNKLNYSISASGKVTSGSGAGTDGLVGFRFILTSDQSETITYLYVGVNVDGINYPPTYTGTYTELLTPQSGFSYYDFQLNNLTNISGGLGTREAQMTGIFDFSIVDVPEPPCLTLLAVGALGLLAYGWRLYPARNSGTLWRGNHFSKSPPKPCCP